MKLVGANLILVLTAVLTIFASAADNEVFITQSGTNAQIEIDQIGSGNTVEGNEAAGSEPISDFKLTGNSQTVDIANNSSAANLDYDAVINGDYNTWTTSIDSDNVTFNVDVNGSNGSIDYDADGYAVNSTGHTFILDQDGDYVDYVIDQQSTSAVDYLNLQMTTSGTSGSEANICVYQSDNATTTSC